MAKVMATATMVTSRLIVFVFPDLYPGAIFYHGGRDNQRCVYYEPSTLITFAGMTEVAVKNRQCYKTLSIE